MDYPPLQGGEETKDKRLAGGPHGSYADFTLIRSLIQRQRLPPSVDEQLKKKHYHFVSNRNPL